MDHSEWLTGNLALVDRLVTFVAIRHRLNSGDTEDFRSFVRFRLVVGDFAILRKFDGRSSISTYLTVVIKRLCLDYLKAQRREWRPSAVARRSNIAGRMLERLMVRDALTFDEAVETLVVNFGVTESRERLYQISRDFPSKHGWQPADRNVYSAPDHEIASESALAIDTMLAVAIDNLSPSDTELLRLRFEDNLSIAAIARQAGCERRKLYDRFTMILSQMRRALEQAGITSEEVGQVIGHPTIILKHVMRR